MKKVTPPASDLKQLLNVDPRDAVTNQEAVPVPYFAGTRALPLQWVMDPVNQFTEPSPDDRYKK
jgi:hypothetical protein